LHAHKSALVAHPAATMFELIEGAEHYPAFLPWCADARIIARDEHEVVARIAVDYRGAQFDFVTRNPKRRPHWMAVRLQEGPFRRFEGEWRLSPLGDEACKIEFDLQWEFGGALVATLAGPVFDSIANSLVDAFANRADRLAGPCPLERHHE
jgi:ribosome-associated toxin RatA of RatAB toxin-antitoxin module